MKERPILFSGEMVRAILDGRKTQTRRVVKPQPVRSLPHTGTLPNPCGEDFEIHHPLGWRWQKTKRWSAFVADSAGPAALSESLVRHSPYGAPGDRLWVRETWGVAHEHADQLRWRDQLDDAKRGCPWAPLVYAATEPDVLEISPWKPSIHMPRWASRITLAVTSLRVERLQDVTEEDAKAEGVMAPTIKEPGRVAPAYALGSPYEGPREIGHVYRCEYACLWDEINGKRASWESNPWVWVVGFERVEALGRTAA